MISQRQSRFSRILQGHKKHLLYLILLALPLLACDVLSSAGLGGEPPIRPTLVLSTPIPTLNPVGGVGAPTATLPAGTNPTPVLTGATLTAITDINIRQGPGTQYQRDGFLLAGETAPIIGVDLNSGWWKLLCPTRSDGFECWVTGRAQYVSTANTGDVPAVSFIPPPPPTAAPAGASDNPNNDTGADTSDTGTSTDTAAPIPLTSPALVYLENGNVMALPLTLADGTLVGGTPVQLTLHNDVTDLFVAPQSGKVAYLRNPAGTQILGTININGTGDTELTRNSTLSDTPRLIHNVTWLPDEQGLAFNTTTATGEALSDLWTVDLTGGLVEQFPAGSAGHKFALSATNNVLMASPTEVWQVNWDGSGRETITTFPAVNTRSSYAYAPQVEWLANGQGVAVVSSRNPFARTAGGDVWTVPAGAQPQQTSQLDGNLLFTSVEWNANATQLAYIRHPLLARNTELLIATSTGADPISYATDANLHLFDWSQDNTHFLYRGTGYYAIGALNASPTTTLLSGDSVAVAGHWVTSNTYIVLTGANGSWQLVGNNLLGATSTLLTFSEHTPPTLAIWSP